MFRAKPLCFKNSYFQSFKDVDIDEDEDVDIDEDEDVNIDEDEVRMRMRMRTSMRMRMRIGKYSHFNRSRMKILSNPILFH